jgi:hypothetical protein
MIDLAEILEGHALEQRRVCLVADQDIVIGKQRFVKNDWRSPPYPPYPA